MWAKGNEQNSLGFTDNDLYELCLRKDGDVFELTSDGFVCGPIWYSGPDAVRRGVEVARFRSRKRVQNATVRVLDAKNAVIHTYESGDEFREYNAANNSR